MTTSSTYYSDNDALAHSVEKADFVEFLDEDNSSMSAGSDGDFNT